MISAIHKRLEEREEGFTLIELLVVVIIIGILAAIAIPAFLRQRERAWEGATVSELRNAAVAMESYATQNNGSYASVTVALLQAQGYNQSNAFADAGGFTVSGDATQFCMQATHNQLGTAYGMSSTSGAPRPGTCSATTFTPAP